jgi:hypothetical protein
MKTFLTLVETHTLDGSRFTLHEHGGECYSVGAHFCPAVATACIAFRHLPHLTLMRARSSGGRLLSKSGNRGARSGGGGLKGGLG